MVTIPSHGWLMALFYPYYICSSLSDPKKENWKHASALGFSRAFTGLRVPGPRYQMPEVMVPWILQWWGDVEISISHRDLIWVTLQ